MTRLRAGCCQPPELPPDWREALAAVREALDVPYPRTVADGEVYREILDRRLMRALDAAERP
jgi:hypothetical protein